MGLLVNSSYRYSNNYKILVKYSYWTTEYNDKFPIKLLETVKSIQNFSNNLEFHNINEVKSLSDEVKYIIGLILKIK